MSRPCPASRCHVPIGDDRNVCVACSADLERNLSELPDLVTELEDTLTRARTQTGWSGGKSVEGPLPYDQRASDALSVIRVVLVGWTRVLEQDPHRQPADNLAAISRWLHARHAQLVAHPAASDICDEIEDAVRQGRRARANTTRARFPLPDACPECSAPLQATMHDVGDPRPNTVWCLGEEAHTWEPHQWLRLGHRLGYGRESA